MEYAIQVFPGDWRYRASSPAFIASLRRQLVGEMCDLYIEVVGAEVGRVRYIAAKIPDERLMRFAGASETVLRNLREVATEVRAFNAGRLAAREFRASDKLRPLI